MKTIKQKTLWISQECIDEFAQEAVKKGVHGSKPLMEVFLEKEAQKLKNKREKK